MIPIPDRLALKLIAGIGAALLLALVIHDRNHWKARAGHYGELLAGERAAHAATAANVRAATERARLADAANVERVRAEQSAINERTANDYESRIAAARAADGRLRAEAAASDPSGRRTAPVPSLSAAADGIAQGANQDRLPAGDALVATEQSIQLDELIKWVRRQAAVEPSKD